MPKDKFKGLTRFLKIHFHTTICLQNKDNTEKGFESKTRSPFYQNLNYN